MKLASCLTLFGDLALFGQEENLFMCGKGHASSCGLYDVLGWLSGSFLPSACRGKRSISSSSILAHVWLVSGQSFNRCWGLWRNSLWTLAFQSRWAIWQSANQALHRCSTSRWPCVAALQVASCLLPVTWHAIFWRVGFWRWFAPNWS